jgi:hypothetical protein
VRLASLHGSPAWTHFELLPSNWQCDRTHGRILFSSLLTRRAELNPFRAPSLDTSRTGLGSRGYLPDGVIHPQRTNATFPGANVQAAAPDLSGRKFHLEEERCNLKNAQFPLWLGDFQDRLYSGFRTPRYVEASRVARPKPMRQPVAGSGVDSMSKAVAGPNPKIQLAPPFVES